jgi:hypothetical protein
VEGDVGASSWAWAGRSGQCPRRTRFVVILVLGSGGVAAVRVSVVASPQASLRQTMRPKHDADDMLELLVRMYSHEVRCNYCIAVRSVMATAASRDNPARRRVVVN